ncbi:type II toxin-antitoxin system RelE/ParE family toxin [Paenibacillus sp. strain BS8-2]
MGTSDFSVKFTAWANDDLEEIYSYISSQLFAPVAADKLLDNIQLHVMKLASFPYSGSPLLDKFLQVKGYRKLVVDNYVIFYLIDESDCQVVIMRILYGAQNYRELL